MRWNWLFNWIRFLFILKHKWSSRPAVGKPFPLDNAYKKACKVREATDKRLVFDISLSGFEVLVAFVLAVVGFLFLVLFFSYLTNNVLQIIQFNFLNVFNENPRNYALDVKIVLSVVFVLVFTFVAPLSILGVVYPFLRPKERLVIFDRENQTVTLPDRFWGQGPVTVPFSDFQVRAQSDYGATMGQIRLFALRPNDMHMIRIGIAQPNRDWGTFVRYMRQDLPLPKGELLDPYRERDAARRAQAKRDLANQPMPTYIERDGKWIRVK